MREARESENMTDRVMGHGTYEAVPQVTKKLSCTLQQQIQDHFPPRRKPTSFVGLVPNNPGEMHENDSEADHARNGRPAYTLASSCMVLFRTALTVRAVEQR